MKQFIALILTSLLFQNSPLEAQTVPCEKYTSKNGLVSDRVTSICQDDQGFMWFGSYFGISRYDGIRFDRLALPPSQQNKYVSFLRPANHKVYAGFMFQGGLAEIDGQVVRSHFIRGKDSAFANEFLCMGDNGDGSLLLANSACQVYEFKEGQFRQLHAFPVPSFPEISCVQKDRDQNIWVGTSKGLYLLPAHASIPPCYFSGQQVFLLRKNRDGRMVVGLNDGSKALILSFDSWRQGRLSGQKSEVRFPALLACYFPGDLEQGFWAIDRRKRLLRYNRGSQVAYQTSMDGNTDIRAVFADRENNVWIGNEPGVLKISHFNIRTYLFGEMAVAGGSIGLENESSLWVSNSKALYHIDGEGIHRIHDIPARNDLYGYLHPDRQHHLWLGLWNGGVWQSAIRGSQLQNPRFRPDFEGKVLKVQEVAEDHQGNIWIGGANGLFHIRNGKIMDHYQPLNAHGLASFITCLSLDEKNQVLWLGDNAEGVIRLGYTMDARGRCLYHPLGFVTEREGLKDKYVRSILADGKGNIWAGTRYGGIYRISDQGRGYRAVDCHEAAQLSCSRVSDIEAEDSTAIWFATCDGIYRYFNATGQWQHYNTSQGLLNAEVFNLAVDASNKCVWALSAQGMTRIRIGEETGAPPPRVNITSVSVQGRTDGEAIRTGKGRYAYDENSVSFQFIAPSFIDEKKIRYKYRLEGYDDQWSEAVSTNSVHYASLPPGKYAFRVMAMNAWGQWSSHPASFEFHIILPVYRRPWFIFLVITAGLFSMYLFWLQRLRHRYRIERIRLNIARDLHDDVGSALGSINILSKTASRKLEPEHLSQDVQSIFHKIGQSAEDTLEAMDDIVWAINPDKDKAQDLLIRMREFAIPLLEARDMAFRFHTDVDDEKKLSMDLRRNIFLIFKEAIHNILKHADAREAHISLQFYEGVLRMTVRDDGKGFDPRMISTRHGLKNMYKRAEMIKGKLEIRADENGSCISFTCPLK